MRSLRLLMSIACSVGVACGGSHTVGDAGVDAPETSSDDSGPTSCVEPGRTEELPCGRCGMLTRLCTVDRVWAYGACSGEGGECTPGTMGSRPCGMCGVQQLACGDDCTWSPTTEC